MKDETYTVIITTADAVGQRFMVGMAHAKAILGNDSMVRLSVGPADDPIGVKQRGFLHGVVLPQIAQQAYVGEKRERFVADIWKEHFHRLYIPDKIVMRKLPGQKRATPRHERVSSESLGARRYAQWIDKIIDHAIVELGVHFEFNPSEREAVRFVNKPREEKQ